MTPASASDTRYADEGVTVTLPAKSDPARPVAAFAVTLFLALCAIELAAIVTMNSGRFVYTLDDPYIHLAMAENIRLGHYGVNPGELSAPASSIIWPFLLAPVARMSFAEFVPLCLNLLAAVATVLVFVRILKGPLRRFERPADKWLACVLLALLIPTTNLVGLVFTGMEHSLQVLLAVLVLYGIIREQETDAVPWWLELAIVAGPLVRYENLALSVPAFLYLIARRRYRPAFTGALALLVCVGGFSVFLHSMGLGFLPGSVLGKSRVVASGGASECENPTIGRAESNS